MDKFLLNKFNERGKHDEVQKNKKIIANNDDYSYVLGFGFWML